MLHLVDHLKDENLCLLYFLEKIFGYNQLSFFLIQPILLLTFVDRTDNILIVR